MGSNIARVRGAVLACLAALPLLWAHAAPPAIEDFTRKPFIGDIRMSPSGNRLAVAVPAPGGRAQLAVMQLSPLAPAKAIAGFKDGDVTRVRWVNDERIVFFTWDRDGEGGYGEYGLFAVNADGSKFRHLIARRHANDQTSSSIRSKVLTWDWHFHSTVDDGSDDIIVAQTKHDGADDLRSVTLSRLNTLTGELRSISVGAPDRPFDWLLDGKGRPRAVTTFHGGKRTVHWRADDDKPWTAVAEFSAYGGEGFEPWYVDPQGQLLVLSSEGRGTSALYRFDPVAKKMEAEPLISLQGFDLDPVMETDPASGRLVGVHFRTERPGSYWFDAGLRKLQQGIDAALPAGRFNRLHCGRCESTRFFVVESSSDRLPGDYYLFDRSNSKLQRIALARPWIAEAAQGTRSYHRVPARDGLSLPVYITRPLGSPADKPLPAVVLVHGGPWLRGHDLVWDADAQFLSSRGYLVIETEYRGSTGYGFAHFRAGWKQWGHAMQDDLADAIEWAAKQGWADTQRVCIVGASYGGYAALMGPIRNPSTYRCAVSYVGVSDIELMYDITWSDFSFDWKRYGMPRLIGDRKEDAERLVAASPLQQVARIKVPLMLAHSGRDRRVPIQHSTKFRDAAEAAGVTVEWINYPNEGHGWYAPENQVDFWSRVEKFLDRHIGAAAAPVASR